MDDFFVFLSVEIHVKRARKRRMRWSRERVSSPLWSRQASSIVFIVQVGRTDRKGEGGCIFFVLDISSRPSIARRSMLKRYMPDYMEAAT